MKAVFLAVLFVCLVDFTANRAAGLHAVGAAFSGIGHAVGAWVFYT